MYLRWISDGFQMDLRWISDGSQMDLRWISDGSQMNVHLVILTTYYYPIGFVYLLYFLYWNQPTSASSGSYAILFLLFLFLLLLLPPLKIRLSETFRMPKFLHHFCSPWIMLLIVQFSNFFIYLSRYQIPYALQLRVSHRWKNVSITSMCSYLMTIRYLPFG